MKLTPTIFVLPLLFTTAITSCVDSGYYGDPRFSQIGSAGHRGYYTTLPSGYIGSAYYYNGRYYSGGNYQTGRYTYQGRSYNNRYYHNGQYLYGGLHQNHGPVSTARGQSTSPMRYYNTLPSNYVGGAYYQNGRYYSGGNYQTGRYTHLGRTYNNRYHHNGQYIYGGVYQNHGSPRVQPSQNRPEPRDFRDGRDSRSTTRSRFFHSAMNR